MHILMIKIEECYDNKLMVILFRNIFL